MIQVGVLVVLIFAALGGPVAAQESELNCRAARIIADDVWVSSPELTACANAGDADSEALLGMMYWGASDSEICDGAECVLGDPEKYGLPVGLTVAELRREGRRLLESAASKNQSEAQNELGLAAFEAGYGTMADVFVAREWFEKSTAGGDSIGPFNLARIHFGGLGVPVSEEKGEYYLRLSSLRGYEPARCSLMRYFNTKNRIDGAIMRWTVMLGVDCTDDEFLPELPMQ